MIEDKASLLEGIHARVDAVEGRVDGLELEIGRSRGEGLRGTVHHHGNIIQTLISHPLKLEAVEKDIVAIKVWGRMGLLLIPLVIVIIQHYWK